MQRSDVGRRGEDVAARYLEAQGWRVVERNFRRREGEIDIVVARHGVLAASWPGREALQQRPR